MTRSFQQIIDDTPQLLLRKSLGENPGDPKLGDAPPVVYAVEADIEAARAQTGGNARVELLGDANRFKDADAVHGLLYLPYRYVVPAGALTRCMAGTRLLPFSHGRTASRA